ncbi:MAG TPA: cupin domain-containing protein [Planctomycetota bacterium]|nr:cupin domain-containing protein [Planctomycetota bacterium]
MTSSVPQPGAPDGCFHDTARAATFRPDKLAKTSLFESPRMFCDVYGLLPGQSQAAHAHAGSDKVYSVLTGRCRIVVGSESRTLATGEVAIAPAGVEHAVHNESDSPATLLVVMAPHPKFPG